MKKFLTWSFLFVLASCATSTDAGTGLIRLDTEPKNCEFLYHGNKKLPRAAPGKGAARGKEHKRWVFY